MSKDDEMKIRYLVKYMVGLLILGVILSIYCMFIKRIESENPTAKSNNRQVETKIVGEELKENTENNEIIVPKTEKYGQEKNIVTIIPQLNLFFEEPSDKPNIKISEYEKYALIALVRGLMRKKHIEHSKLSEYRKVLNQEPGVLTEVTEILNLKVGDSIADIGVGPGFYLKDFFDAVGPQGKVYVRDTDPNAIEFVKWVRDLRLALNDDQYTFDAKQNQFDDVCLPFGSIDWAFFNQVHIYTYSQKIEKQVEKNVSAFTKTLYKALKQNGKVMIVEGKNASPKIIISRVEKYSGGKLKFIKKCYVGELQVLTFKKS